MEVYSVMIFAILLSLVIMLFLMNVRGRHKFLEISEKNRYLVEKYQELIENNEMLKHEVDYLAKIVDDIYGKPDGKEERGEKSGRIIPGSYKEFSAKLHEELEKKKRHEVLHFSVMLVSMDFYAEYLNIYPIDEVEKARRAIAETVMKSIRRIDFAAKSEDAEALLVILPMTNLEGAGVVADRIRKECRSIEIFSEEKRIMTTTTIIVCEPFYTVESKNIEKAIMKMKEEGIRSGGNVIKAGKI